MATPAAIQVDNLVKLFSGRFRAHTPVRAVNRLSFTVTPGATTS